MKVLLKVLPKVLLPVAPLHGALPSIPLSRYCSRQSSSAALWAAAAPSWRRPHTPASTPYHPDARISSHAST